jgi:hypothetical protein
MTYSQNAPFYEAVQWDGTNAQDCVDFAAEWFIQYPSEPPYHDTTTEQIVCPHTGVANLSDWLVFGGMWAGGPFPQQGMPMILDDATFQARFATN